ncbi:MAG: hypothetical protein JW918_12255 [Anaerolineae bacterium]|nr:hypothetical protein [Anaerolineae bacterium]
MATWRREIEEYEADLYRVQEPTSFLNKLLSLFLSSKSGEMEMKRYDDGEKVIEVELHGFQVPDGAVVSAVVDGTAICQIQVNRGHGRSLLSTARGETVTDVRNGSAAEIHYQEQILAKGTFKPD